MRKLLIIFCIFMISCTSVFAAKIPEEITKYIKKEIPQADIRFDGVITFPDNTVYLPLLPSLFSDIKNLNIKKTYPDGKSLKQEPDIVIFNNDFVLMKVLSDGAGHRTVMHLADPPLQIRTGLLPQDMLVPSGLIIPENIKGIIGNLKIDTKNEDIIKVENKDSFEDFLNKNRTTVNKALIPYLKNKVVYVSTNLSKNIQIINPPKAIPSYSLAQKSIPIDVKSVHNGKFLLVTTYDRPFLDIISVADSRFIKQIALDSNPEQILIDHTNNRAYVTSPSASMIYTFDLNTMSLIQKIKVNGYCEHMILADNKIFYVDKLQNEIWAIELNNDYLLRDIGKFPNVSALAFTNNKLYISSRTKSRIAIIDYETFGLANEFTTVNKPISMIVYNNLLYILGAQNNDIQILDTSSDKIAGTINLGTGGFSKGLKRINETEYAVVSDIKNNYYSIIDLSKNKILESYEITVPINDIIIADKVMLFE